MWCSPSPSGPRSPPSRDDAPIADLTEVGARALLARGGGGGRGNAQFRSSTNRAPRRADAGGDGEECWIRLRLKLLADVGLVGLPNAGKSTLLAAVSRARPKIADYPFTTLIPHLGVAAVGDEELVIADIPGLIEGAHGGAGLGDRFLGHIERCGVLLHLVDGTQEDVAGAYRTVRAELAAYGHGLAAKPEILCLNKVDALGEDAALGTARVPRRRVGRCRSPSLRRRRRGRARGARRRPPRLRRADFAGGLSAGAGRRAVTRPALADASRTVIKIGSSLLAEPETGALNDAWLDGLARDVAALRARGMDVLIVSSGAIAIGRRHLGLAPGALKLEEMQAAAACGQIRLAHAYQAALARHGIGVAQILLTHDDTEARRRYLNARSTINTLLSLGTVPVINENDTVATNEIRFGDNDRLAARVAVMMSADLLVLLSDVDGLYETDPRRDADARWVPVVERITPEIEAMAGDVGTPTAAGGMVTKIAAARHTMAAGCHMVIARGAVERPLAALEGGARSTWFVSTATPRAARKSWIASALEPRGALVIDEGARRALTQGRSLLPAGVKAVEGSFERGDAVAVRVDRGGEAGRGLVAYSAADARRIMGHKSREIERILGYRGRAEMIHRDDLVLDEEQRQ